MKRIVCQFVVACSTLVALGILSSDVAALAAAKAQVPGSIGGVVRDSAGTPQVGILIELLRADSTLVAHVYTDRRGTYSIASVLPGQYALKAAGGDFIPTLKENLKVRANTVVNLTLNSLYDLMQWTPRIRRPRAEGQDDWAWTLRSSENRPLLRWQADGSPIFVWDGSGEGSAKVAALENRRAERRRLRVAASAGDREFGSGPEKVSAAMIEDVSDRRRMAASINGDPEAGGVMDAMLGFRQEMANTAMGSSSVQTLLAVMSDPEAGAGGQQGVGAISLRTWESIELLNNLEAEAGSDQVLARLGEGSGGVSQVTAALPFGSLTMHHGQSSLQYRVATARAMHSQGGESGGEMMPGTWLPILSERDGNLVLEHGLHQELGWSTTAGPAEMRLVVYGDDIENPVIEGGGRLTDGDQAGQWMLLDRASSLVHAAGPNYSTAGVLASVESKLPGHNRVKLSYASGDALVLRAPTAGRPEDLATILGGAHARRAQMYSLVLSGTVDETGTRWRASYRWQPESTVTEVAPFALDASEPYLNVYIRQPIWPNHQGTGGVEAQLDLRNLLAEGYQPFITSDGSHLYFAQAQRCIRGGLAFTF